MTENRTAGKAGPWLGMALAAVLLAIVVWQFVQAGRGPQASRVSRPATVAPAPEPTPAYREVQRIPTGLRQSTAIALDDRDRLHAAGDGAVVIFDGEWQSSASVALAGAPTCLAVAEHKIYVGFRDHLEVFDGYGVKIASWPSLGERSRVTSVAVSAGECWVGDAGNRIIRRFDLAGKPLGEVGKRDPARNIPGLVAPSPHLDVAAGRDGYLHVANPGRHLVETYTPAGERVEWWGETSVALDGFSGCCNPTDIALFSDGRVVTAEKGIVRVKLYGADGTLHGLVAPAQAFSPGVVGLDLAIDRQGRIYVLDPGINAVRVFAPATDATDE